MSSPNFERLLDGADTRVDLESLKPIGSGLSSRVFGNSEHVVKVQGRRYDTQQSADKFADTLYGEQQLVAEHLGAIHVAIAEFVVGKCSRDEYAICLIQPRVDGVVIDDALAAGIKPDCIEDYFTRALMMYTRCRRIPDLACIEGHFFNPLADSNTQVVAEAGLNRPVLVDTTYGRLQRSRYAGPIIHSQIAFGVKRALRRLR